MHTCICEHVCVHACVYLLKHLSLEECSESDGARQVHGTGLQPRKSCQTGFVSLQVSELCYAFKELKI